MCGLIGFSGDPKMLSNKGMAKAALAKIKILGLYNIERGKHSCGLYVDNIIHKGVDKDKLFSDFIVNNELTIPFKSQNYIIIGHTRAATHGEHSSTNAHPFYVNDSLVLAHNGVIRNIWPLCNKYGVNHTNPAIRVDSLALTHLIDKEGFKILNEYEGYAALLMYKVSDPNSLYMYRGESIRTTNGDPEEERPLYYMQSEEGIYISSLEKSLIAITDASTDRIKMVDANTVIKITNGRITRAKYAVDRGVMNVGYTHIRNNVHTTFPQTASGQVAGLQQTIPTMTNIITDTNSVIGRSFAVEATHPSTRFDEQIVPVIWHESLPSRVQNAQIGNPLVMYHMGRYWKVHRDEINLMDGSYYVNRKGRILSHKAKDASNCYFYEGILLHNLKAYTRMKEDVMLKNPEYNFACLASKYSEYPICNTRSDFQSRCKGVSPFIKTRWYHNEAMINTHGFTPKFSDRNYTLKDGLLHSIAGQKGFEKEPCINIDSLKAEREANHKNSELITSPVIIPGVIRQMHPPVNLLSEGLIQKTLPFVVGSDITGISKPEEFNVENFYRTWDSIENIRKDFTEEQLNACRYYTCDVMMAEMEYTVDNIKDDCVDVQLNMLFAMAVQARCSLIDLWDEKNYKDVYHYMLVARENPDGAFLDPIDESIARLGKEIVTEVCNIVPKTLEDEINNKGEIIADPKDDVESPFIDVYIEEEAAGVPREKILSTITDQAIIKETLDSIEEEEEVDYAVEDIIDYSQTVRDAADELQGHENNDFCQEVANIVYKSIDPMLIALSELALKHNQFHIRDYMNERGKKYMTP